jgi:hypothetical protein
MKPPAFEYHRPATVEKALAVLAEVGHDGKVLAGGQSLVPLLNMRLVATVRHEVMRSYRGSPFRVTAPRPCSPISCMGTIRACHRNGRSSGGAGAHLLGEELLPGAAAHRPLRGQVGASPDRPSGPAGRPDRQDRPVPVGGPQVASDQLGQLVDPRSAHVSHQAGRRTQGQLHQPGRHLPGVDRLEPPAGRNRHHRQPGQLPHGQQGQVMELGGPQRRPAHAGAGDHLLGGPLGCEVAEHRPVDAACDRDPVGANDRDEHQVPDPGL